MNRPARLPLVVAFVLFSAACAIAGTSPVGNWTGRIVVDTSKMATKPDPQTQEKIRTGIQAAQKVVISMTFKANKTFTAKTSGGPVAGKTQTGTWSQSGNTVTLTRSDKAPDGKLHSQVFTMSKNGKTLSFTIPGGAMGIVTKIVFSR